MGVFCANDNDCGWQEEGPGKDHDYDECPDCGGSNVSWISDDAM
jgi:hypothetical protein